MQHINKYELGLALVFSVIFRHNMDKVGLFLALLRIYVFKKSFNTIKIKFSLRKC